VKHALDRDPCAKPYHPGNQRGEGWRFAALRESLEKASDGHEH
jgi:hypothetical protein